MLVERKRAYLSPSNFLQNSLRRESANFKCHKIHILGFLGRVVSFAAPSLCHCSVKAVIDHTQTMSMAMFQ